MPKPLLPPRGLFVPTTLIFDKALPAAAKDTAVQLRALAWGQDETPPLSITQLEEITGKSKSTLYGHMRLLRLRGALRWRSAGTTEIIVAFEPTFWISENLEKPVKELTPDKELPKKDQESTAFQNYGKQEKAPKADYYPLAQALAEVCHMDLKANRGRLFAEAKLLSAATPTPTPDLLKQHYNGNPRSFWRGQDWRGKQGQDPSPANVRETWGKWSSDSARAYNPELSPEELAIKAQMKAHKEAQSHANH